MCLDCSVALLISLKIKNIQKRSTTFDINIPRRDSHIQQNISPNWISFEQSCDLVEIKLRYPLPRHSFNAGDVSLKTNIQESVGSTKFNDTMNLANPCRYYLFLSQKKIVIFFKISSPNCWLSSELKTQAIREKIFKKVSV